MTDASPTVSYEPGDWAAVAAADSWLLVAADPGAGPVRAMAERMVAGLHRDDLLAALADSGLAASRSFAFVLGGADGCALARGAAHVEITDGAGDIWTVDADGAATWVEVALPAGPVAYALTDGAGPAQASAASGTGMTVGARSLFVDLLPPAAADIPDEGGPSTVEPLPPHPTAPPAFADASEEHTPDEVVSDEVVPDEAGVRASALPDEKSPAVEELVAEAPDTVEAPDEVPVSVEELVAETPDEPLVEAEPDELPAEVEEPVADQALIEPDEPPAEVEPDEPPGEVEPDEPPAEVEESRQVEEPAVVEAEADVTPPPPPGPPPTRTPFAPGPGGTSDVADDDEPAATGPATHADPDPEGEPVDEVAAELAAWSAGDDAAPSDEAAVDAVAEEASVVEETPVVDEEPVSDEAPGDVEVEPALDALAEPQPPITGPAVDGPVAADLTEVAGTALPPRPPTAPPRPAGPPPAGPPPAAPPPLPATYEPGPSASISRQDTDGLSPTDILRSGPRREEGGPVAPSGRPDLTAPVPTAVCAQGHGNDPQAAACRQCGAAMPPQQPTLQVRPPMGVLHLSTGDVVPVDRGVLAGRNPHWSGDPARRPHLVQLSSPQGEISRNHLEVTVDGWRVLARDLGSTNGTTVTGSDGAVRWLTPGTPAALSDGDVVSPAHGIDLRYAVSE